MPVVVVENTLKSRLVRIKNSLDPGGIRRINFFGETTTVVSGVVNSLRQKLSKFIGFAFGLIARAFPFSISSIFGMLVQAYFAIKTFDWNSADKALEEQIKTNNQQIKDGLAPIIGNYLGFGTIRLANFALGKTIGKLAKDPAAAAGGMVVPVLSSRVGLALAEEGNEELRGLTMGYLMTVQGALTRNMIASYILTARNNRWFGWEPITTPLPNASFSEKIENKIESLPKDWQNFVEELVEEYEDAVIEAGFVMAFEIDDYYLAMKSANKKNKNEQLTTIEIESRE